MANSDWALNAFSSDHVTDSYGFSGLVTIVQGANQSVKTKLAQITDAGSTVSIANMFDMQMLMNRLTHATELGSNVIKGGHDALSAMLRNVK